MTYIYKIKKIAMNMKVSIGLPVFNGENFLKQAIDSILSQTYEDLELIISDNASTDNTSKIVKSYNDPRIRYYRNDTNKGAAWNYNRVFELAKGEYFKWAAHDDVLAPEFLQVCIEALEQNPAAVLSYPRVQIIDEQGKFIKNLTIRPKTHVAQPHRRFAELVLKPNNCRQVFGVIRRTALGKTKLIGHYTGSDNILLGHLALLGKFIEIPKPLFFSRKHPEQSIRLLKDPYAYAAWFDPVNKGKIMLPWWKLVGEYMKTISQTPLDPYTKMMCYLTIASYGAYKSPYLVRDLLLAPVMALKGGRQ